MELEKNMSIYEYSVTKRNNESLSLKDFKNKVILIVNTATGCGFTPQYAPIEEMYKKYHEQGLGHRMGILGCSIAE